MKPTFPIVKTMLIDVLPYAECIDAILKDVLLPYRPGVYLPDQTTPTLVAGDYYSKFEKDLGDVARETPIRNINDVIGDIYNHKNELIASISKRDKISTSPTLPANGLTIIHMYVNAIITENSQWLKSKRFSMEDICKYFVRPEYRDEKKVYDTIFDLTYEIRNLVMNFIGDDKNIMHFSKLINKGDLSIEKSIDYRIIAWESLFGKMDIDQVLNRLVDDPVPFVENILIEQGLCEPLSENAPNDLVLKMISEAETKERTEKVLRIIERGGF